MKRISSLLCLASITFSSSVLANQNGYIYVAANAGIFQADFVNTYLDQTDVIAQNIVQPAEQHGYTGGVSLGYRQILNPHYFLGGELSGSVEGHYASFQSGAATAAFSDAAQIYSHVDLMLVPGIRLNSTTDIYLKLGLSCAFIQDSLVSPAGYTPTITNYNSNNNTFGFTAGLGFEKWITKKIALFTEANYHDYGSVNFQSFQNFSATYQHSSHIYSYDVVIGASYQFNI